MTSSAFQICCWCLWSLQPQIESQCGPRWWQRSQLPLCKASETLRAACRSSNVKKTKSEHKPKIFGEIRNQISIIARTRTKTSDSDSDSDNLLWPLKLPTCCRRNRRAGCLNEPFCPGWSSHSATVLAIHILLGLEQQGLCEYMSACLSLSLSLIIESRETNQQSLPCSWPQFGVRQNGGHYLTHSLAAFRAEHVCTR